MGMARPGADTSALWKAFKEQGDPRAREQLIVHHIHLVKYVAGRVAIGLPAYVDTDDLYSYGIFGLMNAVDRFDHLRGIKFETYAITRIKGAILDGLRAMDWVPSSLRQRAKEMEDAYWRLESRLGRSATDEEVAAELGLAQDEFQRLLQDLSRSQILSLDEIWAGEGEEGEFTLKDLIADEHAEDPFASAALAEVRRGLAEGIEKLPEKERLVVTLYYFEGLTAKEIGEVMRLSVSRISQLHSKALLRLRGRLGRVRRALRQP